MTQSQHPHIDGLFEGEPSVLYHRTRDPEILFQKRPITLPSGHSFEAHTLSTGGNTRSVVVIAVREDEVLLVQSFRPSLGELIWELPRGFGVGDPHDTEQAERDAARELLEETGYTAVRNTMLGEFVLDTTFYPSRLAVVRCEVADTTPSGETDGEVEKHAWHPVAQISELVRRGVLRDGASLSALAIAGFHMTR